MEIFFYDIGISVSESGLCFKNNFYVLKTRLLGIVCIQCDSIIP